MTSCKICNKTFKNNKNLSSHLKIHDISSKNYYDTYLKKDDGFCKECGKETQYYDLTRGYCKFCSSKCTNNNQETKIKINETNLKKYGEHHSKTENCKTKSKNTRKEKYGDENFNNTEKTKKTNLEKYGVENVFQLDNIKEKIKKTNIEKYGNASFTQTELYKEKSKKTNLEKYGCESPNSSNEVKDYKKRKLMEKYGVENVFQLDDIKEKIKKTNIEKYGVEYPLQNKTFRENILSKSNQFYRLKIYTLKDGSDILYQSKLELKYIKICENNNIHIENGDVIDYQFNNKKHYYHVDFKIKEKDKYRLVEIKGKTKWFYRDLNSGLLKSKILSAVNFSESNDYLSYVIILNNKNWNYKNYFNI